MTAVAARDAVRPPKQAKPGPRRCRAMFAFAAAFVCADAFAAPPVLQVADDEDFPQVLEIGPLPEALVVREDKVKPTPEHIAAVCAYVRLKQPGELGRWARAIAHVSYTCDYQPNENNDGLATSVKAVLRPGAVTMFGVPVIEANMEALGRGGYFEYVLDAPFRRKGHAMIAKISAHCREKLGRTMKHPPCSPVDGHTIYDTEISVISLAADEKNPERMIYSKARGE